MTYDWDGKRTKHLRIVQAVAVGMTLLAVCAVLAALLAIGSDLPFTLLG